MTTPSIQMRIIIFPKGLAGRPRRRGFILQMLCLDGAARGSWGQYFATEATHMANGTMLVSERATMMLLIVLTASGRWHMPDHL